MAAEDDLDTAIERFRNALNDYLKGDPQAVIACMSRRDDVSLANPLGPPRVGPAAVDEATAAGAASIRDGSVRQIEEISRYGTPDLGYVVQIERTQARLVDSDEILPFALRVTLIFRPEDGTWKVVHRHADPITTPRPVTTAIDPTATG